MPTAAPLALAAWRHEPRPFQIIARGIDLTGQAMVLEVRLSADTPGAPLLRLTDAAGLHFDGVETQDSVVISTVSGLISQAQMEALPYAGELGDNASFAFNLQLAGVTRAFGSFTVLATVNGADAAPTNRPAGYGSSAGSGGLWDTATLAIGADTIEISVDGTLIIQQISAGLSAQATSLATQASVTSSITAALASAVAAAPVDGNVNELSADNVPPPTVGSAFDVLIVATNTGETYLTAGGARQRITDAGGVSISAGGLMIGTIVTLTPSAGGGLVMSDPRPINQTPVINAQLAALKDVTDGLAHVASSGEYGDLKGLPNLGSAAGEQSQNFATSAQGHTADSAVQPLDVVSKLAETSTAKIMTGDERTKLGALPTADGLSSNFESEATARSGGDNLLQVSPDTSSRPGDSLQSFTLSVGGGDPTALPKIDPSLAVVGADGAVRAHYGAAVTASAIYTAIEPDRVYRVRFAARRIADVINVPVTFGLLWFDDAKAGLAGGDFGAEVAQPTDMTFLGGRRVFENTFGRAAGSDFLAPAATRYARGFIQTMAAEQSLQAELVEIEDITDAVGFDTDLAAANDLIEQAELSASAHSAALADTATQTICTRSVKTWTAAQTTGFTGWGIFDTSQVDDVIDGFALYLSIPANVASFDVQVISRAGSFTAPDAPGTLPGDIVHQVLPRATFAPSVTPPTSHATSEESSILTVIFGRALQRSADRNYALMAVARDVVGSLVQVGRIASDATGLSAFGLGWTYGASGVLTKLPAGADATAGYVLRRTPASPPLTGLSRLSGSPIVTGLAVDLRGVMVRDLNGLRPLYNGLLNVDAASSGVAAVHRNFNMTQGSVGDYLEHSNVKNVVVRLAGGTTVLTPGVDYHVDPSGRLYGTGDATQMVDVTYDWANERIDLIAEVPESGTTVLIKGTERVFTAHEDLYRAKPTDPSQRPLYHVRVVGGTIAEIIPVWDWIGTFAVLHHNEVDAQVRRARDQLAGIRVKLTRGDGIIISGYGSSLIQMGGGAYFDPTSFEPNRYNANGATDLSGFLGGFYATAPSEADFRTAFFAAQSTVTLNGQVRARVGPIWRVIDAIIAKYGYTFVSDKIPGSREITFLNQGIGASTMEATPGNVGDPARLAKLIDPSSYGFRKPDLVIMDAGMNGTPSPAFPGQVDNVLTQITAAGIAVMIYGPQLINVESPISPANRMTLATWRSVHAQIRNVAMRHPVAYMPMDMLQGPGFEGYLGLSQASCCRTNFLNHDGPYEQRKRGEFLALGVL